MRKFVVASMLMMVMTGGCAFAELTLASLGCLETSNATLDPPDVFRKGGPKRWHLVRAHQRPNRTLPASVSPPQRQTAYSIGLSSQS
jgi:hypothetical protein